MRKLPEETRLDCLGTETLLDAYLDGDLAGEERTAFEAHVGSCEPCAQELRLAERVKSELGAMPLLSCPPELTRAVFDHAASHPPLVDRLRRFWSVRQLWQPAFALLFVAVLGVVSWRFATPPAPPVGPPPAQGAYTEAEIAQAEAELKIALAYLGEISGKAREKIGAQLEERVVVPFARSITLSLLPFPQSEGPEGGEEGGKELDHAS